MVKWMIFLFYSQGRLIFFHSLINCALVVVVGKSIYAVAEIFLDILKKNEQYTKINKGTPLCRSQVIGSISFS